MQSSDNFIVTMQGISKSFDGIKALDDIDFELGNNEIIGLLGDNGAGKSTLIKILSGVHSPDTGEMTIQGKKIKTSDYTVRQSRALGIETVYQERSLGDNQPIWRNIFIGRHITNRFGCICVHKEKQESQRILKDILGLKGESLMADSKANVLSGGERQGLAIGRAMYFDARIIILDEPTTALSLNEVGNVLNFIRSIKERGKSCIFITHTLGHVYPAADRFVLMDKGHILGNYSKTDISAKELAELMLHISSG